MKKILFTIFTALVFLQACKEDEQSTPALSSLRLVNAAIDIASVKLNTEAKPFWYNIPASDVANFANSRPYAINAGTKNVLIAPTADSTKFLVNEPKEFKPGQLNSLFLCGQAPTYEHVYLADESFPKLIEEAIAFRFINLSPGSPALSVNLAATPTVNETANLAYKQVTAFKNYPDVVVTNPIVFQVRNATTGVVLATYTLPVAPVSPYTTVSTSLSKFRNVTLVVKGLVGTTAGVNAFGLFPVPHY
ncbi:MAG: DUF4397 domain-containing protein [Chitinophagaceae bacterium]|nr:DUF4397 domain-containing protein [Chitinophagaceae bacterium]